MFTKAIASLLLFSTAAHAASHGGPCPGTFNAGTLFPGQTVKNFVTDMGATCNGVTDDTPAVATWLTYAISQNPACVVLFIPPGSKCNLQTLAGGFSWNGTRGSTGPSCINVWAQGATFITNGGFYIGGQGFYEDTTHDAPIQQANINDGAVTLINSGDAAIFAVNDWIAVTGLQLQTCCGYPPNFHFYEFKQITNIAGTVITLSTPLVNQYLTTWPSVQQDASMNNSGPARIYKMQPNWNVQYGLYWGTVVATTTSGNDQDSLSGRKIIVCGTEFRTTNTSPTASQSVTLLATSTGGMEVDKIIETLTMSGANAKNGHDLTFQSPTPTNFFGTNLAISGSLNGTPTNSSFVGGSAKFLSVGNTGYGATNSISMNAMAIPGSHLTQEFVLKSNMDPVYSSGTFTVPKAAGYYGSVIKWAVPGYKYGFAAGDGTPNSSPLTKFKILSIVDNGTTISINTDLVGSLPTPTCGGIACTTYQLYGALSVTQTNKPAGTVDITGYQAPP